MLAALAAITAGCKKDPEPTPLVPSAVSSAENAPAVEPTPTPGAGGTANQAPVAIVWDDPPQWAKLPPRGLMRRATYEVPTAKGDSEKAEVAVFYFGPGQGGGIETNVERWAKQFGTGKDEVKRSNRRVNDLEQHIVEIPEGKYKPDMMQPNQEGMKAWAMLAAIVESPSGSYFFKLTGPSKTVKEARPVFYKMLDSVKAGS
jgi:hypothetical protein